VANEPGKTAKNIRNRPEKVEILFADQKKISEGGKNDSFSVRTLFAKKEAYRGSLEVHCTQRYKLWPK